MLASRIDACWTLAGGLFQDGRMTAAGLRHGVTTKNLGDMKLAPPRERALRRAEVSVPCHLLRQVHGTTIHTIGNADEVPPEETTGDGWLLRADGVAGGAPIAVGVYTADCVPLFVWHASGDAVGVYHAGWRGMQAGMARKAVESFVSLGYKAAELRASIGPHIGSCCFKVGADVAEQFRPSSVIARDAGAFLDLAAEALSQLTDAGLDAHAVAAAPACTSCRRDLFYSYRRDKVLGGGRMLAFVMAGAI